MNPQSPAPLLALSSELPELPCATVLGFSNSTGIVAITGYTADQMRAYAKGHAAYWYEMWRNRRDAYNELLAAKGWLPIESAPKDNVRPLYLARIVDGAIIEIDFDASWETDSESWEMPKVYHFWKSANGIEEPTHWAYQDGPPPAADAVLPWGFNFVDVVGTGFEGAINLFWGDHCLALVQMPVAEHVRRHMVSAQRHGSPDITEELERMDAVADPKCGLLTVSYDGATANGIRRDMSVIRAALTTTPESN